MRRQGGERDVRAGREQGPPAVLQAQLHPDPVLVEAPEASGEAVARHRPACVRGGAEHRGDPRLVALAPRPLHHPLNDLTLKALAEKGAEVAAPTDGRVDQQDPLHRTRYWRPVGKAPGDAGHRDDVGNGGALEGKESHRVGDVERLHEVDGPAREIHPFGGGARLADDLDVRLRRGQHGLDVALVELFERPVDIVQALAREHDDSPARGSANDRVQHPLVELHADHAGKAGFAGVEGAEGEPRARLDGVDKPGRKATGGRAGRLRIGRRGSRVRRRGGDRRLHRSRRRDRDRGLARRQRRSRVREPVRYTDEVPTPTIDVTAASPWPCSAASRI